MGNVRASRMKEGIRKDYERMGRDDVRERERETEREKRREEKREEKRR